MRPKESNRLQSIDRSVDWLFAHSFCVNAASGPLLYAGNKTAISVGRDGESKHSIRPIDRSTPSDTRSSESCYSIPASLPCYLHGTRKRRAPPIASERRSGSSSFVTTNSKPLDKHRGTSVLARRDSPAINRKRRQPENFHDAIEDRLQ